MADPQQVQEPAARRRVGIVLAGGGARGAYEAGVLSYLFERIYPRLGPGFEFDVVSGTSVGAIHAAYLAATAHLRGAERSRALVDTWRKMAVSEVMDFSAFDLLGLPLRALGLGRRRSQNTRGGHEVIGGLVDVSPLERIVHDRVPWEHLRDNLNHPRPMVLCVSCTEVRTGRVTVFMDGPSADAEPWDYDPNAKAISTAIGPHHVRASAALPFLFPAVRIGDRYYLDGGLRMNTPLSPALRLRCDRVLVVALKHAPLPGEGEPPFTEDVITQPAFLLGKVLDALMLDQLEYELHRIGVVNALIDRGQEVYGDDFLDKINVAVRGQRGVSYRRVASVVLHPSHDLGRVAADCWKRGGGARSLGMLPSLLARLARSGVPEDEADLLSYLFFDRAFTRELLEMGRSDAASMEDEIVEALGG